jgi:hypothetical protein
MFEVGERIVCINNIDPEGRPPIMKLYSVHKVKSKIGQSGITISIGGQNYVMNSYRFVSLVDFRRKKIEKICSRLVT